MIGIRILITKPKLNLFNCPISPRALPLQLPYPRTSFTFIVVLAVLAVCFESGGAVGAVPARVALTQPLAHEVGPIEIQKRYIVS